MSTQLHAAGTKKPSERAQIVAALERHQRARAKRIRRLRTCDPKVLGKTSEVFESPVDAGLWLIEETSQLAGLQEEAPIDLIRTANGRAEVLRVLGRIEYGIPP
jgi:uncharacterized protein (DUF2384 family)